MTKKAATPPRRIEYMPLDDIPDADRNPKGHDTARIAGSISRFGFADAPILDERTGQLVAGHGRKGDLIARKEAGQDPPEGIQVDADGRWLVPVQRGWASRSAEDAQAFLVAHNRLTETGGWNDHELAEFLDELRDIDPDLLDLTGYTDDDLDDLIGGFDDWGDGTGSGTGEDGGEDDDDGGRYTTAVNIPQYQPVGPPPPVSELYDTTRRDRLVSAIDAAEDVPDDLRAFLREAANRHTVVNYRKVAELYPHLPAEAQALVEDQALVLIDVDDAIARGFVRLSARVEELRRGEAPAAPEDDDL